MSSAANIERLFDLYLITPDDLAHYELVARVERTLSQLPPGRVAIQLRQKHRTAAEQLALARALRRVTARYGVAMLVNDRVDVALAVGADGVHLPERGLPIDVARRLLPEGALIGLSRHDAAGLAQSPAASFACLAPFGRVPGKGAPLGAERFGAIARTTALPVFALGGIGIEGIGEAIAAGAHGVALIREGLGHADCDARAAAAIAAIDAARLGNG